MIIYSQSFPWEEGKKGGFTPEEIENFPVLDTYIDNFKSRDEFNRMLHDLKGEGKSFCDPIIIRIPDLSRVCTMPYLEMLRYLENCFCGRYVNFIGMKGESFISLIEDYGMKVRVYKQQIARVGGGARVGRPPLFDKITLDMVKKAVSCCDTISGCARYLKVSYPLMWKAYHHAVDTHAIEPLKIVDKLKNRRYLEGAPWIRRQKQS